MKNLISSVDPFIGIDGEGNCLCGPYLPLSLVRLGPDTVVPQSTNGYKSDKPIIRFSHTHVSGTGGGSRYGNVGITPFIGEPRIFFEGYGKEEEQASLGYYSVILQPAEIKVELTSTPRVGVHRYKFPEGKGANILVDAGAVIQTNCGDLPYDTGESIGGFIEIISDYEIVGRGDYQGGHGSTFSYSVYFYAVFDKPFDEKIFANGTNIKSLISNYAMRTSKKLATEGPDSKAIVSFLEEEVGLKVGISFVSIAKARKSVEKEVGNKSFETIREEAEGIWEKLLSKVQLEGGTPEQKKLFYTMYTRLYCMPGDMGIDDEFPLWESGVRQFNDFYCLWDSVRNANSLITLLDPKLERDILNCIIDIADHYGWLPDTWIAFHPGFVQGGSSVDVLLCEAALKGIEGIDFEKALRYMRKNAEEISPDVLFYGRRSQAEFKKQGYLTTNEKLNCVSRSLEFAYQDWCIGKLAEYLGQEELSKSYFENSKKVWNLWREDLRVFGPKDANGEWINPLPLNVSYAGWCDPFFYEGSPFQWMFNIQHDFSELINRCGGNLGFNEVLDRFFAENHYHSKETMLHIPYLYNYVGRPDKTAKKVQECLKKYFRTERQGLSDNEDMGAQSSWFMLSSMGLYPIMGQDIYLLTTPSFSKVEIKLGDSGKKLIIEAPDAGSEKLYIIGATINGQPLNRSWFRHSEIIDGAVIHLVLGDTPNDWGTKELPPCVLNKINMEV